MNNSQNTNSKLKICIVILAISNIFMILTAFTLSSPSENKTVKYEQQEEAVQSFQSEENVQAIEEEEEFDQETEILIEEILNIPKDFREILLINKQNALEEDYVPPTLTSLSDLVPCTKEIELDETAANDYKKMYDAMNEEGLTDMFGVSGYRSYAYQNNLFVNQMATYSSNMSYEEKYYKAGRVVAPPGTSEHQSGLAIDVSTRSVGYDLNSFGGTAEHKWIEENAPEYGFIIRYTQEKTDITGIISEPWHLRYIGVYHAQKVVESGLALEEYVETTEYIEFVEQLSELSEIIELEELRRFEETEKIEEIAKNDEDEMKAITEVLPKQEFELVKININDNEN